MYVVYARVNWSLSVSYVSNNIAPIILTLDFDSEMDDGRRQSCQRQSSGVVSEPLSVSELAW